MSPATVAIVVAVISAVIALISATGVEVLRRRANRELEVVKHELAEQRAANDRRAQTAELVRAYRNPLLRAAYDLQSRIWNIHQGFRGRGDTEHDYFVTNTLYVIAEFFGWLEIVRRELQFLDLADEQETGALKADLDRIQGTFASTSRRRHDDFYIYRGQQRAIGELMIVELAEPRPTGCAPPASATPRSSSGWTPRRSPPGWPARAPESPTSPGPTSPGSSRSSTR